jgi:hypothetical protein
MTDAPDTLDSASLLKDPALLLRGLDLKAGQATLTPMTAAEYAAAERLDGAIETAGPDETVPLEALDQAVIAPNPGRRSLHFIFQKGNCGAALFSRILGEVDGLFSLREPAVLDMLGRAARRIGRDPDAPDERAWRWANTVNLTMMARTWKDDEHALVAAPAHCTEIMRGMLGWSPQCRALLLYVDIERFIAAALHDDLWPAMERDVAALYHDDFRMIARDEAPPLVEMSRAQRAAAAWLVHGCEYRRMVNDEAFQGRAMAVDFDTVLTAPGQALMQICAFLEKPLEPAVAAFLTEENGPMHQFARRGHPVFGPNRKTALDGVRCANAAEIDAALAWAEPWQAKLGL